MTKGNPIWRSVVLAGVVALSTVFSAQAMTSDAPFVPSHVDHVLLISVDGLHAVDLEKYIASHPKSALAKLAGDGVRYTNASTSKPSDSFPGLLSMVTGGSPKVTGVYYDDAYDRTLVAPVILGGQPTNVVCTPNSPNNPRETEELLDETVDKNDQLVDGGGGINPQALPRDPVTCAPVYPHSILKVNTIFEVLKSHQHRTAWSDKHLSYDLVNGPSGTGVDDLYTPEIVAPINVGPYIGLDPAGSQTAIQAYDSIKVKAILNEIDGFDHARTTHVGVPAIFGMNFQTVSVGQKLEVDAITGQTGGYLNAGADPTPLLADALTFVDESLGRMVAELKDQGRSDDTVIIVTAKHSQDPIDPTLLQKLGDPISPVLAAKNISIAQLTTDDVALIWLADSSQAQDAATALRKASATIGISSPSQVLVGAVLHKQFGFPSTNPIAAQREPDLVVVPNHGVIYTSSTKKIMEHGGFIHDDTNVALLISGPKVSSSKAGGVVTTSVTTYQIAPTILSIFGVDPTELQAVQGEGTTVLPSVTIGP